MTREELARLFKSVRSDSANVELAAHRITTSLDLADESQLTAQELREAAIELVWIATSSDRVRNMLELAMFGKLKRRRGNPGKSFERESAISIEGYREYLGLAPASTRRLARHIGVSRPTISAWRNDPSYQKGVSEAAQDTIVVIVVKPAKI